MMPAEVHCPWCEKGQVFVEGSGEVSVTVRCAKCQHCYKVNLQTMGAAKIAAYKRTIGKAFRQKLNR